MRFVLTLYLLFPVDFSHGMRGQIVSIQWIHKIFVFITINEFWYKVVAALFYYAKQRWTSWETLFPEYFNRNLQNWMRFSATFFKYLLSFFHHFVVVTLVETYALHFKQPLIAQFRLCHWWCWCSKTLSFWINSSSLFHSTKFLKHTCFGNIFDGTHGYFWYCRTVCNWHNRNGSAIWI